MAVAQPYTPSLAGNYANIQNALQESANINAKTTGVAGSVAAGLEPIAEQQQKQMELQKETQANMALIAYKSSFEDQLAQHKSIYDAQAAGKNWWTQEQNDDYIDGVAPGLPDNLKPKIPGGKVMASPDDVASWNRTAMGDAAVTHMAQTLRQNGKPAAADFIDSTRGMHDAETVKLRAMVGSGIVIPEPYNDLATGTIKYRDTLTKQPLPGYAGSAPPTSPGAINDLPTLRAQDKTQHDAIVKAAAEAPNDVALKTPAKSLDELSQIEKLVKANIPGSQINISADTAQAIGGVPGGRFSSLLAMKEGKDPSLLGSLGQKYQTITAGNLSKNNQDLILKELAVTEEQKRGELASALQEKHKMLKQQAPLASDDFIASQLGYQRYLKGNTNSQPSPQQSGQRPVVNSQADYDKLPSGTKYLDSNGTPAIKP